MPSFLQESQIFVSWLSTVGVTMSPKITVSDLRKDHQGRGVVAVEDIEANEDIFTIPRSAIINVSNCSLIEDKPHLSQKLLKLSQWESLVVVLLYELKVKNNDSKWLPYFNVLPIKDTDNYFFNQLVHWSDEDLSALEPSLILERVGKDVSTQMFNRLYPKIIVERLGLHELKGVTIEEFFSVASLIMSYSFDVERPASLEEKLQAEDQEEDNEEEHKIKSNEEYPSEDDDEDEDKVDEDELLNGGFFKSMVPLADTLNADTTLHNASLTYSESGLIMRSIKPIKKGEQVYNSYFDHPNSEILRRYGYVETQGSSHDFAEIPLAIVRSIFSKEYSVSTEFLDEIFQILNEIVIADDEDGESAEIVLDSYDCFKTREVILEFVFIIQVLTIILAINEKEKISSWNHEEMYKMVHRVFQKCYQLVESKKLTNKFKANFEKILKERLKAYPQIASEPYTKEMAFSRAQMAEVVLKSEYQSLKNCLEIDETFKNGPMGTYKFIEDEKLIRNIMKKRAPEDSDKDNKKRKL
ncbi:putative transcription regulator [Scheffersomyces xylosifermentans]|uniref:putative transcription regulator n=1 Tax=Scheffersomyces xylosifermentans TaxID=1304137 RepID=UPI00315D05F7